MEDKKYIKGDLLSNEQATNMSFKEVKVICVDKERDNKEFLGTVVQGEFVDCRGNKIRANQYDFCLRLEKENQYGATYSSDISRYGIYEAIEFEEEDAPKFEYVEDSGVFIKGRQDKYELVCKYENLKNYIAGLNKGESFYIKGSSDRLTFSIEQAVKIKDYLIGMIGIAEESGYFTPKVKMTLAEVEAKLGCKIEII